MFSAVIPGLMLGNLVLWIVPPVRRHLDTNARGVKGLGFRENMLSFAKAAAISVPAAFVLVMIGAVDPWR